MSQDQEDDVQRLQFLVRAHLEHEEIYLREREEAFRTKWHRYITTILEESVTTTVGSVLPDIIEQVKRRLPAAWFR